MDNNEIPYTTSDNEYVGRVLECIEAAGEKDCVPGRADILAERQSGETPEEFANRWLHGEI